MAYGQPGIFGARPQPQGQDQTQGLIAMLQGMQRPQPTMTGPAVPMANPMASLMPANRTPMTASAVPGQRPFPTGPVPASPMPAPVQPAAPTTLPFPGQGATPADWQAYMNQVLGTITQWQHAPGYQPLAGLEFGTNLASGAYGGPLAAQGYGTLGQILGLQGHIDPRAGNQIVSGIQRDTQTGQQNTQGELARRGLGASGIGQALAASQGQAGANEINKFRANEAQQAEQQKRQDLQLLMEMIINPAYAQQQLRTNWISGQQTNATNASGARDAANSQYANAIVKIIGAFIGGG